MSLYNRIGKFELHWDLVRDQPDIASQLFQYLQYVPLRCELVAHSFAFEHIGYSPLFRELNECEVPPEYIIEADIQHDDDGVEKLVDVKLVEVS